MGPCLVAGLQGAYMDLEFRFIWIYRDFELGAHTRGPYEVFGEREEADRQRGEEGGRWKRSER